MKRIKLLKPIKYELLRRKYNSQCDEIEALKSENYDLRKELESERNRQIIEKELSKKISKLPTETKRELGLLITHEVDNV